MKKKKKKVLQQIVHVIHELNDFKKKFFPVTVSVQDKLFVSQTFCKVS